MIDEEHIKKEARLIAIEHLLTHHFALATVQLDDDEFDQMTENWRTALDQETFPGANAATSDLLSAEIRDAMLALLENIRENRAQMIERFSL